MLLGGSEADWAGARLSRAASQGVWPGRTSGLTATPGRAGFFGVLGAGAAGAVLATGGAADSPQPADMSRTSEAETQPARLNHRSRLK